ncbi:hypothetical protein [Enterobacter quasiroggenkampii]|uniref:hypothetical protein n=1 Tax=Enterobacter quasiroggenkampii TaxID=2497436 RepID=UPI001F3A34B5|nr:hypothetical protein [Enterobacter quasiroggenkampii]
MDATSLTTVATLLVALITGLLAYAATSSSKEKETKLSVFEKLGIETHAALERLQNNTEYLIQTLLFSKSVSFGSLRTANEKLPPNYEKLRELRVRVMFFDKKMFEIYESALNSHGDLLPKMLGYGSSDGSLPPRENRIFTHYERKKYIFELQKILSQVINTKENIANETSKRYRKTLSSSKYLNLAIFPLVIVAMIVMVMMMLTKTQSEKPNSTPTTSIYIIR